MTDERWDEARARRRIGEIVADVEAALRGPKLLWAADPWDGWHATSPMKNLYVGAAGVLWGLDRLPVAGMPNRGSTWGLWPRRRCSCSGRGRTSWREWSCRRSRR